MELNPTIGNRPGLTSPKSSEPLPPGQRWRIMTNATNEVWRKATGEPRIFPSRYAAKFFANNSEAPAFSFRLERMTP